jgi:TonB family protein
MIDVLDVLPTFPGGDLEMYKFIQSNLKYPAYEKNHNIKGTCFLSFVVEKDGSISQTKVLRGVPNGTACDNEAVRIVELMPKWNPGKQNGRAVRVKFNLPVKFTLDYASKTDTTYYDSDWIKCSYTIATYYRLIKKQNDGYLVTDYYMTTKRPQSIGLCSSVLPLNDHRSSILPLKGIGKWVYYSEQGKKVKEGNYVDGNYDGIWTEWNEDDNDSTIVNCFSDGTYENIRINPTKTKNNQYNVRYQIMEWPEFVGGESGRFNFITNHIKFPNSREYAKLEGTCYLAFTIEKDGQVTNVKIQKGIPNAPLFDKEALRVVKIMPKWKPAYTFGKLSAQRCTMSIKFSEH